jgi:LysR family transcriptional regulator, positive regulator for ilvC
MHNRDELRLFLHLAESLSFGQTSADCHVSPATLTRTIQRLESGVGERLLDRGPRGVALTDAGRRFREYAVAATRLWDDYRSGAGTEELAGRLSIFATVTACQTLLPDLLAPFLRVHPGVELDLRTGYAAAALAQLAEGAVDVAVAALPRRLPALLQSREIARTPLVFVVARAQADDALAREWSEQAFVLPRQGLARDAADRWFRARAIAPRVASEVDGHEAVLTLAALGAGIGVVPELVLTSSPVRRRLVELPVVPGLGEFRLGLCVRRADLRRPLVSALWASVR